MTVINVYDMSFNLIGVIDNFVSVIWRPAYYDVGDFEIYIGANDKTVDLFKENRLVVRGSDVSVDDRGKATYKNVMIIKNIDIVTNVETGDFLKVTGKELKYLLHQRIVWSQTNLSGTAEAGIRKIVTDNAIAPSDSKRIIPNLALGAAAGFTDSIKKQVTGDKLDEAITEICTAYDYGWDVYGETYDNLIPYPYNNANGTVNGVTFSDNGDGGVKLSGTATGIINYSFERFCDNNLKKGGTYTVMGTDFLHAIGGFVFVNLFTKSYSYIKTIARSNNSGGTPATFVMDNDDCVLVYGINVPNGKTVNGVVYPKLVEVECENLIPYPYSISSQTINGITFTVNNSDRTIKVNGTATATAILNLYNFSFEGGKTYKICGCPSGGSENGYRMDINGASIDTGNGNTFSRQTTQSLYIRIRVGSGTTVNNLVFNPMLYEVKDSYPVINQCNLLFNLYKGTDRSYGQSGRPYVVFSDKFDNLYNTEYQLQTELYANTALIAGEGEGTARKVTTVNNSSSGLDRYELYVDARDLSQNKDSTDPSEVISDTDYINLLQERGLEKLSETAITEGFSGEVLSGSGTNYEYNVDFYLGDKVTVINSYGIQKNVKVLSAIESEDDNGVAFIPQFNI